MRARAQARAIELLLKNGVTVLCCGGGGIPVVVEDAPGGGQRRRGIEAVRSCGPCLALID